MKEKIDLTKMDLRTLKERVIHQNVNPLPLSVIVKIINMRTKKQVMDTLEKWINPLSKLNLKKRK